MKVSYEEKFKGRGLRKCKICGGAKGMIRRYNLYICRRCFREAAPDMGFEKYS